jgi:ABC-type glycerol-3-phosphate transport system permease component
MQTIRAVHSSPGAGRRARYRLRAVRGAPSVAILVVMAALMLYPLAFMVSTAFKSMDQFNAQFWLPAWPLHVEYFGGAWAAIAPYMLNSVIVTGASTAGVVVLACFSAYAFARFAFPGREIFYFLVIFLLMIPAVLTLVPTFLLIKSLGLMNTRWALILPYVAGGQVLAIFIMRAFFAGLPEELFEAARIDGAGELGAFWRIALPLTRPVLVTVAILQILSTWNDYVWPFLVLQNPAIQTLVVGLVNFQGRFYTNWGPLMAGYTLASIPLLLLFFVGMRSFIAGLTAGALKV